MTQVHSPSAHPHRAAGPAVLALIDRLEKAEAGSRELDGAVWYAVFEPDVDHGCLHVEQTEQGPREVLTCELGSKWADDVGRYTTSLDAALALAERVLPRRDLITLCFAHGVWSAGVNGWAIQYNAPTPALALCIAVLRATTPAEADAVGTSEASAPLQSQQPTPEGREERSNG